MEIQIKYDITLSDYVEKHGAIKTGIDLRVTKGAIWFMLNSKREIYLRRNRKGGGMEFCEVKRYRQGKTVEVAA